MREIRTSGSVGRGWKRTYGSRTEHRSESDGRTHRTLRAPRHLLTLLSGPVAGCGSSTQPGSPRPRRRRLRRIRPHQRPRLRSGRGSGPSRARARLRNRPDGPSHPPKRGIGFLPGVRVEAIRGGGDHDRRARRPPVPRRRHPRAYPRVPRLRPGHGDDPPPGPPHERRARLPRAHEPRRHSLREHPHRRGDARPRHAAEGAQLHARVRIHVQQLGVRAPGRDRETVHRAVSRTWPNGTAPFTRTCWAFPASPSGCTPAGCWPAATRSPTRGA